MGSKRLERTSFQGMGRTEGAVAAACMWTASKLLSSTASAAKAAMQDPTSASSVLATQWNCWELPGSAELASAATPLPGRQATTQELLLNILCPFICNSIISFEQIHPVMRNYLTHMYMGWQLCR